MNKLISRFEQLQFKTIFKQILFKFIFFRTLASALNNGFSTTGLELTNLSIELNTLRWLKRKFKKELNNICNKVDEEFNSNITFHTAQKNKVWILWLQGELNAPQIVKNCISSIKKNMPEYDVVVLDSENLSNYINLPDYIEEKFKNGTISAAHYSDLVRLELLTNHGGIWIDSTVFMTDKLPSYITESDLFLFQILKPGLAGHAVAISSWFMVANKPSKILLFTKNLLYLYWSRYNFLSDYFLFHYGIQLAIDIYPTEWTTVPPVDSATPHILQTKLFEPYSEKIFNAIIQQSSVHKLTYKFNKNDLQLKGTFFTHLFS